MFWPFWRGQRRLIRRSGLPTRVLRAAACDTERKQGQWGRSPRGGNLRGLPSEKPHLLTCGADKAAPQGRPQDAKRPQPSPKLFSAIASTSALIASDAVAPGEGAFSTWIAFFASTMRKSSTSLPASSTACARTPAPPRARSSARTSGTKRCSAFVNAALLSERYTSCSPVFQYLRVIDQKPRNASVPRPSTAFTRVQE